MARTHLGAIASLAQARSTARTHSGAIASLVQVLPTTRAHLLLIASLLLAFPAGARAAAAAIPADADWALIAPAAGAGAQAAAALAASADTRGLQQGFAAGIATGLGLDPLDPAALQTAGIDPAAPLAIASTRGVELASSRLLDGDAAPFATWLAGLGEVEPAGLHSGWQIQLVRRQGRPIAALARRGNERLTARLVDRAGDLLATVHRAIDAAAGKASLGQAPLLRAAADDATGAPWIVWSRTGAWRTAIGVRIEGTQLRFAGRVELPDRLPAAGGGAYPGARLASDLLLARLHLAPAARPQVAQQIAHLLTRVCSSCDAEVAGAVAQELAGLLAGPAALAIGSVDARFLAGERDPAELPFAWVAQTSDPAAAGTRLSALAQSIGATGPGPWQLAAGARKVTFGLQGDRLFVASAPALGQRLLQATAGAPVGRGQPIEIALQPGAIVRALADLRLGDAIRGGAYATLFAIRLQLGPLLRSSGPLEISARPRGQTVHVQGSWPLQD